MAEVDPKRTRDIKIKTGVVKRLGKEKSAYQKEVIAQEAKIEKMKADGKDEYDIKKMGECLDESKMMIPDCKRRLVAAWDELSKLLETEKDLNETEEYKAAQVVLEDTKEAADR